MVWKALGFSLELTLISFSETSLFKGLRGPLGRFFVSARFCRLRLRHAPPRRPRINHACLVLCAAEPRPLLTERRHRNTFLENRKGESCARVKPGKLIRYRQEIDEEPVFQVPSADQSQDASDSNGLLSLVALLIAAAV